MMTLYPLRAAALAMVLASAFSVRAVAPAGFPLAIDDIRVRDPFIYADPGQRLYYLYVQVANRDPAAGPGVEVYRSRDLQYWSHPTRVLMPPAGFWGGHEVWAPEMHHLGEFYYLFVTFNGRVGGRGTQIFRAAKPDGPFELFSEAACTPAEQCSLDGTPWVDADGTNWLVYCHEWVQIGDGAMRALPMSPDWARATGPPIELFRASQAPWVTALRNSTTNFVTDGPFLQRDSNGKLLMLWSSFRNGNYAMGIAESTSGRVAGPWQHRPEPLFSANGGHSMLFRDFAGDLRLVLHQPNGGGRERARFFRVEESGGEWRLFPNPDYAGYLFAHMTKSDYGRLYYSISTNGLHWQALNGGRRVLEEYRGHADICRGHDGRFYLVGNRTGNRDVVFWVSTNLVNWTRFGDLSPDVANAVDFKSSVAYHGAPKIFFDDRTRQYLLTWHTPTEPGNPRDPEAHWRSMRTLFVTSADLRSFSRPRRLFNYDMTTIDVVVRREGDHYFAIMKDELWPSFDWPTGKSMRVASSASLTGPWSPPGPRITPNFREAPTIIPRLNGLGWLLYYEQYPAVSYGLSVAPRLQDSWHELQWSAYSVTPSARHGSMLPITTLEIKALREAFKEPSGSPDL